MTTETGYTGDKALRDRLLQMNGDASTAFWARIQRARCRTNSTHYRRLIEPDTDRLVLDLGPCAHHPEGQS